MRKLISIIRHEDLAHIMAEVAVVKFTMMIQKVTHWSHRSRQADKWQSLHPFFLLILSHGIFIINRNSLHIIVCVSLFASARCARVQDGSFSSPDSAQVLASYFSDHGPTLR